MNVAEAEKNFAKLVDKVYVEGVSVDLVRDDEIIARLTPASRRSRVTVGELNAFLRGLPSLGDDADSFAQDDRAFTAAAALLQALEDEKGQRMSTSRLQVPCVT